MGLDSTLGNLNAEPISPAIAWTTAEIPAQTGQEEAEEEEMKSESCHTGSAPSEMGLVTTSSPPRRAHYNPRLVTCS